jgi:hypothetical protein
MAFVGFDPLKTHRPQMLQFASVCVALIAASLVVLTRHGV